MASLEARPEGAGASPGEPPLALAPSAAVWRGLQRCLEPDVFLPQVGGQGGPCSPSYKFSVPWCSFELLAPPAATPLRLSRAHALLLAAAAAEPQLGVPDHHVKKQMACRCLQDHAAIGVWAPLQPIACSDYAAAHRLFACAPPKTPGPLPGRSWFHGFSWLLTGCPAALGWPQSLATLASPLPVFALAGQLGGGGWRLAWPPSDPRREMLFQS